MIFETWLVPVLLALLVTYLVLIYRLWRLEFSLRESKKQFGHANYLIERIQFAIKQLANMGENSFILKGKNPFNNKDMEIEIQLKKK